MKFSLGVRSLLVWSSLLGATALHGCSSDEVDSTTATGGSAGNRVSTGGAGAAAPKSTTSGVASGGAGHSTAGGVSAGGSSSVMTSGGVAHSSAGDANAHSGGTGGGSSHSPLMGGRTQGGALNESGGRVDAGGQAGEANGGCELHARPSAPTIPTVYLLIDRSDSMFECGGLSGAPCIDPSMTSWYRLRTLALKVVQTLQKQVRFGFVAFTGNRLGMCPMLAGVPAALENYFAISDLYNALSVNAASPELGIKFETPTSLALHQVGADLVMDASTGPKHLVLITDGFADYCDDSPESCAADSVVGELQSLWSRGVRTTVIGLNAQQDARASGFLQTYANAGAGEATPLPSVSLTPTPTELSLLCNTISPWKADYASSGNSPDSNPTLGVYSEAAGPTRAYEPEPSDDESIARALETALNATKTCSFELEASEGATGRILPDSFSVRLNETAIERDPDQGYTLSEQNLELRLDLHGAACDAWRARAGNLAVAAACDERP